MLRSAKTLVFTGILSGLALLAAGIGEARAGFTINLDSTAPSGANTVFNYSASTTADDSIISGSFFRIYDFGNYVPGSITAPAGWTPSVSLLNPAPPPNVILSHGDDPAINNLVFTYNGAAINGAGNITGFSAVSTTSSTTIKDFAGRLNSISTGSSVDSVGPIIVPGTVPEPASLISCGLGALLLGLGYARRRSRATV